MRILIAVLLAAVLVPQEQTAFSREIPKKGSKYMETQSFEFNMTIVVSQDGNVLQKVDQEQKKKEERAVEVLESGKEVTKVSVRYGKVEEAQKSSVMGNQKNESPVSGKSYVVENLDGKIVVKDAEGGEASDEEAEVAQDDFRNLGKEDEFSRIFEGKTFKVGEKSDVSKKLAKELFAAGKDDPNLNVDQFTFTLKGFREAEGFRCGQFDVAVKMSGEAAPGMKMTMDLKGEALVGVGNLWPVSFRMEGDVKMDGGMPDAGMEMKGEGKMKMKIERKYGKSG